MNDNPIENKGWLKRNWKWLTPISVLAIISLIIIFLSGAVGKGADFTSAFADDTLYENAIKKANANNEVGSTFGTLEPVDNMAIFESNVEYTNNKQSVKLTVRVKGSKMKGKMDIEANKKGNEWEYNLIKLRTKNPAQEIIVLE